MYHTKARIVPLPLQDASSEPPPTPHPPPPLFRCSRYGPDLSGGGDSYGRLRGQRGLWGQWGQGEAPVCTRKGSILGEVTSLTPKIAFLARTLALCPTLSRLDEGWMDVNKHTCVSITLINKEFYLIIIDISIVLLLLGNACLSSFVLGRTSVDLECPCRGSSGQPWSPHGAVITLPVVCMTIFPTSSALA